MKEISAARDVRVVVEDYDSPAPVKTPGRPAPTESAEKPQANRWTKRNKGWSDPAVVKVTRIDSKRSAVNDPRIVSRDIAHIGLSCLNDDLRTFIDHSLLRRGLQIAGILRAAPH